MKNNTQLSEKVLETIKAHIDETLRVRCINVVTTLTQGSDKSGKPKLILTSTPFNTVPVIHSAITLCDFGSGIKSTGDAVTFWITVSAQYEGNGVELFNVSGTIQNGFISINGGRGELI